MIRRSSALALLFVPAWLGLAGPRGLEAQLAPLGPETRLPAAGFPEKPLLAVRPDGGYALVWDDAESKVVSHFVAAGSPPPGRAAQLGAGPGPVADSVRPTADGFEALWHRVDDEGSPVAFYRRHLGADGTPAPGRPVLLGRGGYDWVWSRGDRGYLAAWFMDPRQAIGARRLDAFGRPAGPVFRLSSRAVDDPQAEAVPLADGGFVAVWYGTRLAKEEAAAAKEEEEGGTAVLRARRFDAAGRPLGPDFDVNTTPPGPGETAPFLNPQFQVAAAPGGGFAVSWALGQTIYLRYFDAAGQAATPELAAVDDASAFAPESLAFDDQGNLLLLWIRFLDNPDLQIQRFDPHGAPFGDPQAVRSDASAGFEAAADGDVAWGGDGWLVAWAASSPEDGARAVFVRRFARE